MKAPAIIFISLLLSLSETVQGQGSIEYGVKAGLNMSTQFGDTYQGLEFKLGLVAGVFGIVPVLEDKILGVELNYSQEGAWNPNYDFSTFSDVIYRQTLSYNYLNIPVYVVNPLNNSLNWYIGAQLGVRLSANEIRTIKSGTPDSTDMSAGTRNLNNRIKLLYPSFLAGVQKDLNDKLKADLRLQFSLFDNVKRKAGDSEGTYPITVQFSIAYRLGKMEG
ncbi:MAG: hypothetical protein JXR19_06055 [Bacteroidia bacterium]